MSIASEITRLQGVKSNILQAISDKGVVVPADSALDDCPNLIGQISGGAYIPGTVVIGGKTYKTTTIGTQTWLAENLDLTWDGLEVGARDTYSDAVAAYYNNDESTYGWNGRKYGLLYNGVAHKYLIDNASILTPGWHIPTNTEFQELKDFINNAYDGVLLRDGSNNWANNYKGFDAYGFGAKPSGDWEPSSFLYDGVTCLLRSSSLYNSTDYSVWYTTTNSVTFTRQDAYAELNRFFSTRLIKD